ncbi:uncharacterized protein PGTG_13278 [Puccinia graminis f. sp. tritici CRL 75-36-700-3]|uniref:Uncharacterized protein n=1 Tax=Puccinia graminis f. sp. tritici (strain CRL 75-36-700-3 / race SCCL) TaxID=418459 RepID=E3KRY4_PUCGT|nr:uncharacterized protein PGTG_13278 [Puccinia graminis f. sp. tritici CRL 75-36-700-3]EFP87059.2 hypothetical protein PGTG_13278 [Puccinia graminis f. sp. tritici CRL 75-36-700-3]
MAPSKLAFLVLLISIMESAHEIGAIPHPSFKDARFVDSAHVPVQMPTVQMHDVEKPLAERVSPSLQGPLEREQFHDRQIHESIPSQDDPASFMVCIQPEAKFSHVRRGAHAFRYAGFIINDSQVKVIKSTPRSNNDEDLIPSRREHTESSLRWNPTPPRPLKRTRFSDESVGSKRQPRWSAENNGLPTESNIRWTKSSSIPSHHDHENLPIEKQAGVSSSSGKGESDSTTSRSMGQDPVESSTVQKMDLPVKQPLKKQDWMTGQISFFSSEYSKNLHTIYLRLGKLYDSSNTVRTISKKRMIGVPVVMTSIQMGESPLTLLNWIVKTDGNHCPVKELISKFKHLANFITCYHSELLKALGIDVSEFGTLNEALLKWVLNEIFNPSTGFPIIGMITDQKLVQGLGKEESPFRDLDAYLSIYFSRPEADQDSSKDACVLINYWYRSQQTQIHKKFSGNDKDHFMHLLKKIHMDFSVPTP